MILALESPLMTGGSITADDRITWVNEMNATREIESHRVRSLSSKYTPQTITHMYIHF